MTRTLFKIVQIVIALCLFHFSDAADLVYHKAVSKLRLLLSASEEAAMRSTSNDDDEEFEDGGERANPLGQRRPLPFAGSADHLGRDSDRQSAVVLAVSFHIGRGLNKLWS